MPIVAFVNRQVCDFGHQNVRLPNLLPIIRLSQKSQSFITFCKHRCKATVCTNIRIKAIDRSVAILHRLKMQVIAALRGYGNNRSYKRRSNYTLGIFHFS